MFAGRVYKVPDYFEKNYNSITFILTKQQPMLIRAKSVFNNSSPSLLHVIFIVCHCNLITYMQYGICICHLHKLLVNGQQLSYNFINAEIKWMTKNAMPLCHIKPLTLILSVPSVPYTRHGSHNISQAAQSNLKYSLQILITGNHKADKLQRYIIVVLKCAVTIPLYMTQNNVSANRLNRHIFSSHVPISSNDIYTTLRNSSD